MQEMQGSFSSYVHPHTQYLFNRFLIRSLQFRVIHIHNLFWYQVCIFAVNYLKFKMISALGTDKGRVPHKGILEAILSFSC